mmetsp:Transcript_61968/g.147640  ORF Transcript_61968/g.147640 Transcript_61968/m.147640 type:complete len:230 (+) Transcript_61968:830-1519(+)
MHRPHAVHERHRVVQRLLAHGEVCLNVHQPVDQDLALPPLVCVHGAADLCRVLAVRKSLKLLDPVQFYEVARHGNMCRKLGAELLAVVDELPPEAARTVSSLEVDHVQAVEDLDQGVLDERERGAVEAEHLSAVPTRAARHPVCFSERFEPEVEFLGKDAREAVPDRAARHRGLQVAIGCPHVATAPAPDSLLPTLGSRRGFIGAARALPLLRPLVGHRSPLQGAAGSH